VNGESEGEEILRPHEQEQEIPIQEGVEILDDDEGGVKEKGDVVERHKFNSDKVILEDDEGGVDVLMGTEFDRFETEVEKGGVKEQGGVAERIIEDVEGGVDVVMGPQFDKIEKEKEEGGVMGNDNEKGGVDVKNKNKFIEIKNGMDAEEGGVMNSNSFFNLPKRNIERGEGSVRKRKNPYQFIPNHEDESSINSFFSRRKKSRFNFVIDEEQANENEILENHNESRVDQNEMLQKESELRVNQSQNESHINPSFSINENINGGEGGVQSSVSGDQGGIQIENNQSQWDEGG
ncbi:hypothetical protein ROZALSC1DRAFT_25922, partial [Rozella allomycis CSF55]